MTKKNIRWSGPELFMTVSRGSLGFNCFLVFFFFFFFFFCSSIPVVFFDMPGITRCLNTLFLLSPHRGNIVGFICALFVVRNNSWMIKKTSTRTEQIYVLPL